MIVKVQLSLATTKAKRQALIYNEDRTLRWEGDAPLEVIAIMGSQPKAFFRAHMGKGGKVVLDEEVEFQPW